MKHPLVLIPARGGSKRLPNKNLRQLGGLSLIGWAANCARAALPGLTAALSTDDIAIAEEGRRCGLEIPFMRPPELAADDTPTIDVVLHAFANLTPSLGADVDGIVLLQPTSPFRTLELVRNCLAHANQAGASISVKRIHVPLAHVYRANDGWLGPACGKSHETGVFPSGAVYAIERHLLKDTGSLVPPGCAFVEHAGASALDIDTTSDWTLAEAIVSAGIVQPIQEAPKVLK